jgi:2-dehydropantoate 2-reductase
LTTTNIGWQIDMNKIKVLSFGAGAIGTYIGGSLALAGNCVVFLEQPNAEKELRKKGLVLDLGKKPREMIKDYSSSGDLRPTSVDFYSDLEQALSKGPFDFAIFALKSFDTAVAIEKMKPVADYLPPVLCLSNGVDNEPLIAAVLGQNKVIPGTVTSSVGRRGVGNIVLERSRGVGLADGHPLSLFLKTTLNAAGLNARLYTHPTDMKWSKLLTNLPANASAAILDMTAAEVFAHPGLFHLEMNMLRESLAVMRARKLHVVDLPSVPVRALALGTHLPEFIALPLMRKAIGAGRGGKMPSFHIDLHSNRGKSEVEWLNGAVVRYGEEARVPVPVNKILTETLLALTRGIIPLDSYARQPERFLKEVGTRK